MTARSTVFSSSRTLLNVRLVRHLIRQPWWIALSLIQPIFWLVLYGQLFQKVTQIPGFGAASYIAFLTPGIVTMSALFGSGWSGMGIIHELDRGIMDRFLVSPVSRGAIMAGRLLNLALTNMVQSLILIVLGVIMGARYSCGLLGFAGVFLSATLLAVPFGALSNAWALTVRKPESIIGAANFILLPLTFTSPVFMDSKLMPAWMRAVAAVNPVRWSVEAARDSLAGDLFSVAVLGRLGLLATFAFLCGWVATGAFRKYQKSV
jgi:ABC-2 type transport system permease protein